MIGVGETLNDRFTLDKELGRGGMGTVYRATDRLLGRNVAIKFLKESGSEAEAKQIRLEAQILARLVHDKVVRLYDFGESGGNCFLVMEEVNGPSFWSRWRDLLLSDRLRICGQVAEALDYAHLQGVIHRDVKPGNVLLTPNDEAKLSDFGLSVVTGDGRDQSETIRGTPLYMSPEQAQGRSLDHRADLYSVGVMVYECATGQVPFVGHAMAVIAQHIGAEPMAPRFINPDVSSMLEGLILSLLDKDPAKRPSSGRLVALALGEEAERVRRLERIYSGLGRSDLSNPAASPPSSTIIVGDPKASPTPTSTPVNGTGRVAPGTVVPSAVETGGHAVAREMLAKILATPVVISPEERYLCGHYLGYLLGGSRRRGLFLRRPLDARNSDRARLLLAMTWLSCVEPTPKAIERASLLLEDRPDVRALLSPVVVIKYLAGRDTLAKRKRFRQVRKRLQEASAYANKAMVDDKGVLNPGMMPRTLEDLTKIAPRRDALDAHRVSLWNRVAEVWRQEGDFRRAVLRYATRSDQLDAAGAELWPEVVYALIERARWQRKFRPRFEALWDYVVGKLLRVPVPGVRLDRMMVVAIPLEVAEQFDEDLFTFPDDLELDEDETIPAESRETEERRPFYVGGTIPRDAPPGDDDAPRVKVIVPLSPAEPFLFTQATLRNLWEGAMDGRPSFAQPQLLHRTVPVGPYELAVVPTARGRSSVRVILRGMELGKQIEIFTPLTLAKNAAARKVIAIWTYQDGSMAVVHFDFQDKERYILWHAPGAHHFKYDYREELKIRLSASNLEIPDQLDRALAGK